MNILNLRKSWMKGKPGFSFISPRTILLLVIISSTTILLLSKTLTHRTPHCPNLSDNFLLYSPHSGFSNQLSEFKNAIVLSAILNRTLVIPAVLDHHAVALGSCPKFRVLSPDQIRLAVWEHQIQLLQTRRYVSMADIVDISSLVPSSVRAIDFRIFLSLWCGVNMNFACGSDLDEKPTHYDRLKKCGSMLAGFDGNKDNCLYTVDNDCRTTVWTYKNGDEDGVLDAFQPDEQLKRKKKFSYVRRRQDVFKALGPGSNAEGATVLAFGSLFTAPYKGSELYIDIHESLQDQMVQSLIDKTKFLPFVPEILNAGKKFVLEMIKAPFLCAQLRLLDGQFKNHRKSTFMGLKQKLESLMQSGPQPINIFVMTDLPQVNWTATYLGDLANDPNHYKLHFLREKDDLVIQTGKKLAAAQYGLKFGSPAMDSNGVSNGNASNGNAHCSHHRVIDILLYIEESVCSCASLGFIGTAGSTIAESIDLMRKFDVCSIHNQATR